MSKLDLLTQPFADLKVLGIRADEAACGNYRITFPMEFLRRGGAQAYVWGEGSCPPLDQFDIILAQRQYHSEIYRKLMDQKLLRKTLIYEIDDNVHAVHANSPVFDVFKPGGEVSKMVRKFIEKANGLFCSTPELASQYSEFSKTTWVLPNCIDFGIRDWETPVERDPRLKGKMVIGWAGSITHQDDWAPLEGVLDKVLQRYPNTVVAMVSAYQIMERFCKFLNLPKDRVVCLDPCKFEEYPKLPAQFDIGLAPVVNTKFNRAKSCLKPIEYGARHVPYVCSKIAPYQRLHQDTQGQGGFICDRADEWIEAISRLVEDEKERTERGEFMFTYVKEERSMANNVWRWAQALREAHSFARNGIEVERKYVVRENPGRNDPCPCGATRTDGSARKYKSCCHPSWG